MRTFLYALAFSLALMGVLPGTSRADSDEDKPISLKKPIKAPVSQGFGPTYHPVLKREQMNLGVLFDVSGDMPVQATADGKVSEISLYFDGITVIIRHQKGYESVYSHLSAVTVEEGVQVKKGTVIGYVTEEEGAGLYYEFRYRGTALDPLPFFDDEE